MWSYASNLKLKVQVLVEELPAAALDEGILDGLAYIL